MDGSNNPPIKADDETLSVAQQYALDNNITLTSDRPLEDWELEQTWVEAMNAHKAAQVETNGQGAIPTSSNSMHQNNPMGQGGLSNNDNLPTLITTTVTQTIEFHYNGDSQLVGKTENGERTDYALDTVGGLPEVIQTSAGNTYLHLPGGVIVAENAVGKRVYFLSDGQETIRMAVNEQGEIIATYQFDPYGNPLSGRGGEPYGYTGEWWEGDLGMLYLRARWYMPEIGSFMSKDPWPGDALHPQTQNGYNYMGGNPVNGKDPSGMCEEVGDESCWAAYEALVRKFPELVGQAFVYVGPNNPEGSVPLHKLPQRRLEELYRNPVLNVPIAQGMINTAPDNVTALIQIFQRNDLPGQTARERLNWVLNMTADSPYRQFNEVFPPGDSGFCDEFADQEFHTYQWRRALEGKPSNQMGHFLTAVAFGFSDYLPQNFSLSVIVGHELVTDHRSKYYPSAARKIRQTLAAGVSERERFLKAVEYDAYRQYDLRDVELEALLGFPGEPTTARVGNSIEDLRLTIKGWRFGRAIRNFQITTPQQAANWLQIEIYDPGRTHQKVDIFEPPQ